MVDGHARRAAGLALGLLSLVLVFALLPFLTGVIGAPVLYVLFAPVYRRMVRHVRPAVAAGACVTLALLLLVLPAVGIILLLAGDAPGVVQSISSGQLTARLETVAIGGIPVGIQLRAAAEQALRWVSEESMAMIGSATMVVIDAIFALFGLYFLLVYARQWWHIVRSWIPFSPARAEHLRIEFHAVTFATIWGMLLTALLQGTVVGLTFWLVGLQRPAFWGIVTAFLSVLPILGSALVWGPGSLVLLMRHEPGAAITLALIGFIVASNIDNIAMLVLLNRVSGIHPLVAVVGVFAGARLIGIAGVLLGPLLLAYFLELLDAFSAEYRSPSSDPLPLDRPPPDSGIHRPPALSTVGPAAQEGP